MNHLTPPHPPTPPHTGFGAPHHVCVRGCEAAVHLDALLYVAAVGGKQLAYI